MNLFISILFEYDELFHMMKQEWNYVKYFFYFV